MTAFRQAVKRGSQDGDFACNKNLIIIFVAKRKVINTSENEGDEMDDILSQVTVLFNSVNNMYGSPEVQRLLHKAWELVKELQDSNDSLGKDLTDACDRARRYMDKVEELQKQPKVVKCMDCQYRGNPKKCIVASLADAKNIPYFFVDNRGEWFCSDGTLIGD